MCDSITILVLLPGQSQAEYDRCRYPTRGKEDLDEVSSDFRDQYPISPLTGAGFKMTAVGQKLSSKGDIGPIEKNRRNHGRVAGYLVDITPPTCTVGHNRVLVNGVPAAAKVGLALLKNWLAVNGCVREGLNALRLDNVRIISVTPTFLFDFFDEAAARLVLADYRTRSEALCNTKSKDRSVKQPAFSVPPEPDPSSKTYIYTSYIKRREYLIDCYVKVPEAGKKFKVLEGCPDPALDHTSRRTLRIGVKLNGKWLREHGLDNVANWVDRDEPYKQAFGLVREDLQLDKDFRDKQLRAPTVAKLNLSETDKKLFVIISPGTMSANTRCFCK
jgi:hypothetical protein